LNPAKPGETPEQRPGILENAFGTENTRKNKRDTGTNRTKLLLIWSLFLVDYRHLVTRSNNFVIITTNTALLTISPNPHTKCNLVRSTAVSISFGSKVAQCAPSLVSATPACSINHVTKLESVELARSAYGVGPHVVKPKPVPNLKGTWQFNCLAHAVNRVTRRPPYAAQCQRLRGRDVEGAVKGKDVGVHGLVIKHDAVESAVHAIIDVVCATSVSLAIV